MNNNKNVKKLTTMALLVAVSVVLVYLIHFPIFPTAAFLEYDPADVPILIGSFMFGPGAGIILTVVASAVQAMTVSAQSGLYGFVMHVIATSALTIAAATIYKKGKNDKSALIGLICGTAAMCCVMLVANHFITPMYYKMPTEFVDAMLIPVILPFNFIKAGVNSTITYILYRVLKKKMFD